MKAETHVAQITKKLTITIHKHTTLMLQKQTNTSIQ